MQDPNLSVEIEDSLTIMLLQKEKELQDLSKLRISQLQEQISCKDKTIFDLECQVRRLAEDISYKSNLISQRDLEINELESQISFLSQENSAISLVLSSLNSEISELKEKLSFLETVNQDLRFSQGSVSELNEKLQETYSNNNKLKYELDLLNEKKGNIERLYEEILAENSQRKEENNSKLLLAQQFGQEKEKLENEVRELKGKIKTNKEKFDREMFETKEQLLNEIKEAKLKNEAFNEQAAFAGKVLNDRLQGQIKGLLDDNKKLNQQIEHYQNLVIEKERNFNQETYALKKDLKEKCYSVEDADSKCRNLEMELANCKDLVEHWKNLAASRAEELFRTKQMTARAEEKVEEYLKDLDTVKSRNFEEVFELKKEIEKLSKEKKTRTEEGGLEKGKIKGLKEEMERLNRVILNKEQENKAVSKVCLEKNRCFSREIGNNVSRSKIHQVKSNLAKSFLNY